MLFCPRSDSSFSGHPKDFLISLDLSFFCWIQCIWIAFAVCFGSQSHSISPPACKMSTLKCDKPRFFESCTGLSTFELDLPIKFREHRICFQGRIGKPACMNNYLYFFALLVSSEVSELTLSNNKYSRSALSFGHHLSLEKSYFIFLEDFDLGFSKNLIHLLPRHWAKIFRTFPKTYLLLNWRLSPSLNVHVLLVIQNCHKLSILYLYAICSHQLGICRTSTFCLFEFYDEWMLRVLLRCYDSWPFSDLKIEGHHFDFILRVSREASSNGTGYYSMFSNASFLVIFMEDSQEVWLIHVWIEIKLIIFSLIMNKMF